MAPSRAHPPLGDEWREPAGQPPVGPATTDEQTRRYADLCAADVACRTRTDDLASTLRDLAGEPPERWLIWPIEAANLQAFSIVGLTESTSRVLPPDAPATLDAWLSVGPRWRACSSAAERPTPGPPTRWWSKYRQARTSQVETLLINGALGPRGRPRSRRCPA